MRVSGYSHTERYHAINGAIERVNVMKKEVTTGTRSSLFRDRESIMAAKKSKQDWSNTWYLKNGIKSTVSCPVTPGGVLKTKLSKAINPKEDGGDRILVVEDGGRPIHVGLKTRDPLRPKGCIFGDQTCPVVEGTNCDRSGVIYKFTCVSSLETIDDGDGIPLLEDI